MDEHIVKYVMVGVVLLGAFVVAPIVMALLSHQQKMAALFAKQNLDATELLGRLDALERRLGVPVQLSQPPESSLVNGNETQPPSKPF